MSQLNNILNKQRIQSLVYGYISNKFGVSAPTDLKELCLQFYDEVIYWKIKDQEMIKFKNAAHGDEIYGPKYKINEISFENSLCPNGFYETEAGFIEYYLELCEMPDHIKKITIYVVLYCLESNYEHPATKVLTHSRDCKVWATNSMKLDDYKHLKSLEFRCYTKILHIQYKDENKYFTVPINMKSKIDFEWKINGERLKQMKECHIGQHYYSKGFDHNNWCLALSPKGWDEFNENIFGFQIRLLQKPFDIQTIKIKFIMEMVWMNFKWENIKDVNYDDPLGGFPYHGDEQYKIHSSKLDELEELTLSVTIEIIEIMDKTGSNISKDKWTKWGIL